MQNDFKNTLCETRPVAGSRDAVQGEARAILQEKSFNLKPSGDEVYGTNAWLLLINIML